MATQELEQKHFYAASPEELDAITLEQSERARIEAQAELAEKVAPESEYSQGYTNLATFRAIMTAGPRPKVNPTYEAEPEKFRNFFKDVEAFRYAAGEPYAGLSGTGSINHLGIVLGSQYAQYPGESLAYSIQKISGRSVDRHESGARFWGQVLMYNWHAGLKWEGIDTSWAFKGVDEIGVIERPTDEVMPVLRAGTAVYSQLVGMNAIRRHYRDKDRNLALERLPEYFEQVQRYAGELALVVPGNSSPPMNNR